MSSAVAAPAAREELWVRPTTQVAEHAAAERVRITRQAEIARRFALAAKRLEDDSAGVSAPRRVAKHPAYLEILSLGDEAIPYLLRRLQRPGGRPIWLSLLGQLQAVPPGLGAQTIADASEAWVHWGKRTGRLGGIRNVVRVA